MDDAPTVPADRRPLADVPPRGADPTQALLSRVLRQERAAVARAATLIETPTAEGRALLQTLTAHVGRALVIGLAGPPGAGKSSLINALICEARRRGTTVAVIAVDPSSPISGGAILGDRVRMSAASEDAGVFVRSLSSSGHMGGLTPAAVRVIDVFDAAGFAFIFLETVGTGQSEVDIAEIADVRIVLSAPGLGDGIQAMKSGLLEIADVLVVNKCDRPDAEHTRQQLISAASLRPREQQPHAILATSAATGAGVPALLDAALAAGRLRSDTPLDRRRRRARYLMAREAADIVSRSIRSGGQRAQETDRIADRLLAGEIDAAEAARLVLDRPA